MLSTKEISSRGKDKNKPQESFQHPNYFHILRRNLLLIMQTSNFTQLHTLIFMIYTIIAEDLWLFTSSSTGDNRYHNFVLSSSYTFSQLHKCETRTRLRLFPSESLLHVCPDAKIA